MLKSQHSETIFPQASSPSYYTREDILPENSRWLRPRCFCWAKRDTCWHHLDRVLGWDPPHRGQQLFLRELISFFWLTHCPFLWVWRQYHLDRWLFLVVVVPFNKSDPRKSHMGGAECVPVCVTHGYTHRKSASVWLFHARPFVRGEFTKRPGRQQPWPPAQRSLWFHCTDAQEEMERWRQPGWEGKHTRLPCTRPEFQTSAWPCGWKIMS